MSDPEKVYAELAKVVQGVTAQEGYHNLFAAMTVSKPQYPFQADEKAPDVDYNIFYIIVPVKQDTE